ncbi:hypothetical protein BBO99_00005989 [Phytophthora kernoviae]|uniref:Uncharacterized protein n=2 Tax=Phytophthora kernoviae TaxID=325452 RepID=A0A3R7G9I4_9STRA|nr:hypothetical protein G195_008337 [Phytophthora kernoviae 00238/432]KAG2521379.1 hypothetical protein JM16_005894 [Phytophthora kernoviae]KAG2522632.1 hypothetical protein JM18_004798 [Phytophthora kernoviae]RLN45868.1 hypothetical protein BBI17_006067 [Phytophthora kernoviae]RLN78402.1 hypothetical protein BBO99_00005989 [Phytophthora kernoviae]
MDAFAECEEQKERVKACYADWFQKLWGGSFDKANCDQQTQDFRQCVQDAMKRQANEGKRKVADEENAWMDRTKEVSDNMINEARDRVKRARDAAVEEKDAVKREAKGKASDVTSMVQETADSWKNKVKGFVSKAEDKTSRRD